MLNKIIKTSFLTLVLGLCFSFTASAQCSGQSVDFGAVTGEQATESKIITFKATSAQLGQLSFNVEGDQSPRLAFVLIKGAGNTGAKVSAKRFDNGAAKGQHSECWGQNVALEVGATYQIRAFMLE